MSDATGRYSGLIRRAMIGILLGAIVGAIQVWFFKRDFSHLYAAVAAGAVYMTTSVLFTDWLQLAGGRILLGGGSGLLAAVVWWAMAVPAADAFLLAVVAGVCFGIAYAWSDQRMS